MIVEWFDNIGVDNLNLELGANENVYYPVENTIYLMHSVAWGTNGEALAIATHEAGHALQNIRGGYVWSHIITNMRNRAFLVFPVYLTSSPD